MTGFYEVLIDNEESSELADTLSITGRVNDVPCAALLRLSKLSALSTNEQRRLAKQKALIGALLNRRTRATSVGELVEL